MWKASLLLVALAGSVSAQPSTSASTMCPFMPDGTKLVAKDIDGGVELDMSINGNPMAVRARAHQMEASFNYVPPAKAVPSKAQAEDTSNGARLVVMADDPARTDELRAQMRARLKDCLSRS
jgi:hypothetical protein